MIRLAKPEDVAFVKASWLRSFSGSPWALLVTSHDERHTRRCDACGAHHLLVERHGGTLRSKAGPAYWGGHAALVDRLMASCNVSVADNEGMLDGFVCRDHAEPVLHYVYVRHSARGRGVARQLLDDLATAPAVRYTHYRPPIAMRRLPKGWVYDPYALMEVGT